MNCQTSYVTIHSLCSLTVFPKSLNSITSNNQRVNRHKMIKNICNNNLQKSSCHFLELTTRGKNVYNYYNIATQIIRIVWAWIIIVNIVIYTIYRWSMVWASTTKVLINWRLLQLKHGYLFEQMIANDCNGVHTLYKFWQCSDVILNTSNFNNCISSSFTSASVNIMLQ